MIMNIKYTFSTYIIILTFITMNLYYFSEKLYLCLIYYTYILYLIAFIVPREMISFLYF